MPASPASQLPPALQIMAMSYAVIAPLILPIAVVYFCTSLVRVA